jgi:hypothetical protein
MDLRVYGPSRPLAKGVVGGFFIFIRHGGYFGDSTEK